METQRIDRKRKIDHDQDNAVGISLCEMFDTQHHTRIAKKDEGWEALQPLLRNAFLLESVLAAADDALPHLLKCFRIIVHDNEKLRLFRQWVIPSVVKQELDMSECTSTSVSTSTVSSNSPSVPTSIAALLNKQDSSSSEGGSPVHDDDGIHPHDSYCSSSTGHFTPEDNSSPSESGSPNTHENQHLLQQLLQQQQQQIALLQQLQKSSPTRGSGVNSQSSNTISIFPRMGRPSTLLTVTLKGGQWHSRTPQCECALGLTTTEGIITNTNRIPGGAEGEMLFIVPQVTNCVATSPAIPMVAHLTLCTSPNAPIVCSEPFMYTICDRSLGSSVSDEDSEEMGEEIGEEYEGSGTPSPPPQALPPLDIPSSTCPTPKQMMSIRERMMEYIQQRGANRVASAARLTVLQQPSVRVVWKNRRLDVPYKLKVECVEESPASGSAFSALTPSKLFVLAVVADHKGRLQIDAVENFSEDFSTQGIAHFSNLRMTKGTWGKEWTITFAAVVKGSLNNPVIVGVSSACPIVVKTRKNPQVRHNSRGVESSPSSPPQVSFVERKNADTPVIRAKRHRVEDLLDHRPPSPPPRSSSHSEDMASLLAAAEIKQQEQLHEETEPSDVPCLPLMSKQDSNNNDHSFTNFQNLMSHLDEIRAKRHISLAFIDQPQPKRDSKILIVKKGKPFRVPFQVQLRSTAARHNPQQYVCVAVIRNDKGEEVAMRNSEVPFDWKGVACFAGLMVMKGTWGKAVQLTFEARWAAKRGPGSDQLAAPPSWATQRMLVVSETTPTQLMCYTKDKKAPGAP